MAQKCWLSTEKHSKSLEQYEVPEPLLHPPSWEKQLNGQPQIICETSTLLPTKPALVQLYESYLSLSNKEGLLVFYYPMVPPPSPSNGTSTVLYTTVLRESTCQENSTEVQREKRLTAFECHWSKGHPEITHKIEIPWVKAHPAAALSWWDGQVRNERNMAQLWTWLPKWSLRVKAAL